jgi:Domain of unknown function DUF29
VDWANVIEEVEGVGSFARRTVLTELFAALRLVLMARRWPGYQEAGRWLAAADSALMTAQAFADPGMEGRLDLDRAYRDARAVVEQMQTEGHPPRPCRPPSRSASATCATRRPATPTNCSAAWARRPGKAAPSPAEAVP